MVLRKTTGNKIFSIYVMNFYDGAQSPSRRFTWIGSAQTAVICQLIETFATVSCTSATYSTKQQVFTRVSDTASRETEFSALTGASK